MLCERCMAVMKTGTRYEQQNGQGKSLHRRYVECLKCHDRIYTNTPNFQEILLKELVKNIILKTWRGVNNG